MKKKELDSQDMTLPISRSLFCVSLQCYQLAGGALFTLQVGFMSPSFVGIVASIEMVIFCAVGGRLSIFGAIYGTIIVNYAKTVVSENFPELWLFAMGALFIWRCYVLPKRFSRLIRGLSKSISLQRS